MPQEREIVIINYAIAGRRTPIVNNTFINESANLYLDTGSEITLLKHSCFNLSEVMIDKTHHKRRNIGRMPHTRCSIH